DIGAATKGKYNAAWGQEVVLFRTGRGQELEIPFRLEHEGQGSLLRLDRLDYQPETVRLGPPGQSPVDEAAAPPHLVDIPAERPQVVTYGSRPVLQRDLVALDIRGTSVAVQERNEVQVTQRHQPLVAQEVVRPLDVRQRREGRTDEFGKRVVELGV